MEPYVKFIILILQIWKLKGKEIYLTVAQSRVSGN